MRKVVIIGPSGSGKTTLAKRLSETLGLSRLEIDRLFHEPGLDASDPRALRQAVRRFVKAEPRWVVDGSHRPTRKLLLRQAQDVVWLDPPLSLRSFALVRRTFRRMAAGEPLLNGNPARARHLWALAFWQAPWMRWVLRHRKVRTDLQRAIERHTGPGQRVVRLRTWQEVEAWLAGRVTVLEPPVPEAGPRAPARPPVEPVC